MLYASFREPVGIFDAYFNRLAAYVTGGPYCHSEFIFAWSKSELSDVLGKTDQLTSLRLHLANMHDADTVHVAMYIMWDMTVDYRILHTGDIDPFYEKPTKHLVEIECSREIEYNLFDWCKSNVGLQYDKVGALLCWLPFRRKNTSYEKYFCSQLMVCALQSVNYRDCNVLNPGNTSPNALYAFLTSDAH